MLCLYFCEQLCGGGGGIFSCILKSFVVIFDHVGPMFADVLMGQHRRSVSVFRVQIFAQRLVFFNEGFGGFLQYLKLNVLYELGN
jgi:hypothetical protein